MPALLDLLPAAQLAALERLLEFLRQAELERIREAAHAGPRTVPAVLFLPPEPSAPLAPEPARGARGIPRVRV